jgi:hypothetical protein
MRKFASPSELSFRWLRDQFGAIEAMDVVLAGICFQGKILPRGVV